MQKNRLNEVAFLESRELIQFKFNGKCLAGYSGDTLASALLANGVKVVGRSFKYGRPRGIVGHGVEEPNAIVQLGSGATTVPNARATQVEIYQGLEARSVSGWPTLKFHFLGLVGFLGRLMPPGFYYKTFMYPRNMWITYERLIRRAAGLGVAPTESDEDVYESINQYCDVLVVGGGPAGLAAALGAGRVGGRVILMDEQAKLGGTLLDVSASVNGKPATAWVDEQLSELKKFKNVVVVKRCTVFGYYDHNFLGAVERCTDHLGLGNSQAPRERLHRIRAKKVILATGAIERPLVFGNNDIPGVMLASSVAAYLNRYGVCVGNTLVLMTTNDSGYAAALDWHGAGKKVAAIVDTRTYAHGALVHRARTLGITVMTGSAVIEAKGRSSVRSVLVAPLDEQGTMVVGKAVTIPCDVVASSGGWSPVVHLSSHTGARPVWSDEVIGFLPGKSAHSLESVGACNGVYKLATCVAQGFDAGVRSVTKTSNLEDFPKPSIPTIEEEAVQRAQALFLIPHIKPNWLAPHQFVDFQLDVTASGIEVAAREGYESVEHTKRYTAMGFGTDQGKLGNINAMAILAKTLGQTLQETGTTVFRPSYTPTSFGAIAGRSVRELFEPERYTPMHHWHLERKAAWENVGQWKRPWYYPNEGETMRDAVNRECLSVRNGVGIMDGSTLGKIDIQGPDAAEFISRIYTNSYLTLAPGKCRYGVMLKEDGMIFDDGVTACIDENHYLMFTTTGGAANVLSWLEYWHQTEWPKLRVWFTSVTDHWSTAIVAGPKARKLLAKVCDDIEFDKDSFKFMEWRDAVVAGVAARVFRISFSGELSYEVHAPAQFGRYIWEEICAAGSEFDITPYGTEAMHVLRAEKGYIIVGQDTDGSVTPSDAGMDWIVSKKKKFSFVGERSLARSDCLRSDRKQLVGLKPLSSDFVLPEGSQIVDDPSQPIPMTMQGHVSSSYFSPTLGHSFALALLKNGHERLGDTVYCPIADGKTIPAEITSTVFYDVSGERQNV